MHSDTLEFAPAAVKVLKLIVEQLPSNRQPGPLDRHAALNLEKGSLGWAAFEEPRKLPSHSYGQTVPKSPCDTIGAKKVRSALNPVFSNPFF